MRVMLAIMHASCGFSRPLPAVRRLRFCNAVQLIAGGKQSDAGKLPSEESLHKVSRLSRWHCPGRWNKSINKDDSQ